MKKKSSIVFIIVLLMVGIQVLPKLSLSTGEMKTFETDHVKFHYEDSEDQLIQEIVDYIEAQTQEIASQLKYDLESKTDVFIYPNQKIFHRKKYGTFIDIVKVFNNLDWYVGDNVKDKVIVVSPLNPGNYHDKQTVIDVIPHEYCHSIIYQINPKTPLWINEGISLYLTNGAPLEAYDPTSVPSFEDIQTSNPIKFANIRGYEFSHIYIEYLAMTYGFDTVLDFLYGDLTYETTFGKSDKEVYEDWLKYLEAFYL